MNFSQKHLMNTPPVSMSKYHQPSETASMPKLSYKEFIQAKECLARPQGLEVAREEINPLLKEFAKDIVQWAIRGGRRALFESFGLHKTVQQLEISRLILRYLAIIYLTHRKEALNGKL